MVLKAVSSVHGSRLAQDVIAVVSRCAVRVAVPIIGFRSSYTHVSPQRTISRALLLPPEQVLLS
jgi:hypothetical protein